jgi:hypothetical protein
LRIIQLRVQSSIQRVARRMRADINSLREDVREIRQMLSRRWF